MEAENYFLKIIIWMKKQLSEQLGLPQKVLAFGAVVFPIKEADLL